MLHGPAIEWPFHFTVPYSTLGLAILVCAIVQLALYPRHKKFGGENRLFKGLALAQICFGIAVVSLMVWYLISIEPYLNSFPSEVIAANGGPGVVFHDPGWERLLIIWKIASFFLGLAVTALGIKMYAGQHAGTAAIPKSRIFDRG